MDDEAIQAHLSEQDVMAEKTTSGIYFETLHENEGGLQPTENHVASIHYSMRLLSGNEIMESNADSPYTLKFNFLQNAMIPEGVQQAVTLMREEEIFRFYIPSYWAFGEYSHPGLFSVNSSFIVEVELVSLKTEEEVLEEELENIESYLTANGYLDHPDGESLPDGLFYLPVSEGDGISPRSTDRVQVHYTLSHLDGTVIETTEGGNPVQARLGQDQLVSGLETGIKKMKEGGDAVLVMPSSIAHGKSVQVIPLKVRRDWAESGEISQGVPPYTPVVYEVNLVEVE